MVFVPYWLGTEAIAMLVVIALVARVAKIMSVCDLVLLGMERFGGCQLSLGSAYGQVQSFAGSGRAAPTWERDLWEGEGGGKRRYGWHHLDGLCRWAVGLTGRCVDSPAHRPRRDKVDG